MYPLGLFVKHSLLDAQRSPRNAMPAGRGGVRFCLFHGLGTHHDFQVAVRRFLGMIVSAVQL